MHLAARPGVVLLGTRLSLALVLRVLQRVRLVDVKSQIFLQLLDLCLRCLTSLEVLLGLCLQRTVRLHEVVVELDELLHFLESVARHLGLVAHLVLRTVLLGIFVAGNEGLVLAREQHDTLLRLHLGLQVLLIEGIDFLALQVDVDADQIDELLNRVNGLVLNGLLWTDHLLELSTQVRHRLELVRRNQPTELRCQVRDRLQVGDLPVHEPADVGHVRKLEPEELTVELQIVVFLHILVVFHALRD